MEPQKKEIDILNVLHDNENPTQREIARQTKMSLGMVNTLIKRCVKKGLIKVEKLNSRNLRYILTPAGMTEVTKKTLVYIKKSYQAVGTLVDYINEISEESLLQGQMIHVLGERDEIYELITRALRCKGRKFKVIKHIGEINGDDNPVVYYWDPDKNTEIKQQTDDRIKYINVLTFGSH